MVFSHGWPLSADDWDIRMMFFLSHGYRGMPTTNADQINADLIGFMLSLYK
jgi:hypothetical protein